MSKQRKLPQRKCVVTNEMKPKNDMIRIVRNKEKQVFVDPTGKLNGRGAYITVDENIIKQAKEEKVLEKTFQVAIDEAIYNELLEFVHEK